MENEIILDDSFFDDAFLPEHLAGRDWHLKEIARCLNPAKSSKQITNVFIYGPPGVGKTLVCKWILREHFPKNHAYINCWSKRTGHKVIQDILQQVGKFVTGKESTTELEKRLQALDKKLIVCLDESDHLLESDILYTLASNCHGLILISNDAYSLSEVDDRIRSRILLNEIEFKHYTREEIISILNERILHALAPEAINANLVGIVAGMCNGDARIGLQIIMMAARDAESNGFERITIEEIKNASRCVRKRGLPYLLEKLNEHQRAIYKILKENKIMESGKLYAEYCKVIKDPVVDRAYRKHMKRMEELGLVKSEGSGRWKKYEIV